MVRRFALPPRAVRSASSGAGRIAVPGIAADPRARNPGVQQEREPACPALLELAQRYGASRDKLVRPSARAASCPARRRARCAKVGTKQCGRSPGTGLSPPSAAGSGRRLAGPYQPDGLRCRPGCEASTGAGKPRRSRGCRSCGPGCSGEAAAQGVGDGEQPEAGIRGVLAGRPGQTGLGHSGANANRSSSQRAGSGSMALPR